MYCIFIYIHYRLNTIPNTVNNNIRVRTDYKVIDEESVYLIMNLTAGPHLDPPQHIRLTGR